MDRIPGLSCFRLSSNSSPNLNPGFPEPPLFNDERYGGDKILKGTAFSKYKQFITNCFKACPRHALHAKKLGFIHPASGEPMLFETVIPEDMASVIRKFENYTTTSNWQKDSEE